MEVHRRRAIIIALLCVVALCFLDGCSSLGNGESAIPISDYLFQVEGSVRDMHNMLVEYSLIRRDGGDIDPELRFEMLSSMPEGSGGSTVSYARSEDGKTLQIEERWSTGKIQKNDAYSVTIKNLVRGKDEPQMIAQETRTLTFNAGATDGIINVLRRPISIETTDCGTIHVSEIQLSPIGLHIKMKIPNVVFPEINTYFSVALVKNNGEQIEIQDGKNLSFKNAAGYCDALFYEKIAPLEVCSIVICGNAVPVNG